VKAALLLALAAVAANAQDDRRNWFDDPFEQATSGLPTCPTPEGPLLTEAQAKAQAHGRIERGTSCFRDGRCRLPNAYLYDKEIVPRVVQAIRYAGSYDASTSVWVEGSRRWVWLKGCVSTPAQRDALEALARRIDDVESVIVELQVLRPAAPR
jgi:osmotically-inducible protein OsmY